MRQTRRSADARIADMLEAISVAREALAGRDAAALSTDRVARLALERAIEIVSEASRHLPEPMKASEPSIPWRQIADIGNVLRHAYQSVDPRRLASVVERDLDPLAEALQRMRLAWTEAPDPD